MELQQFGEIEIKGKMAKAMLCVDADRPNDCMLQWWFPPKGPAGAVLTAVTSRGDDQITFSIQHIFRIGDNGAIYTPRELSHEERGWSDITATLTKEGTIWKGQYRSVSGTYSGLICLEPPEPHDGIAAMPCKDWDAFKAWCTSSYKAGFTLFRGHGNEKFRLTTTLHRLKRHRMARFWEENFTQFHLQVEGITGHKFSLGDGIDAAHLLALGQHHGLPTPMLDWSNSPYIAAFFAFADALENATAWKNSFVRVFALSQDFVNLSNTRNVSLNFVASYASPLSTSARMNPRLRAQQGNFLVTNVADLEAFLCRQYPGHIIAVDIPIGAMDEALVDLRLMGITQASLFPGVEGIGKMIRHEILLQNRNPANVVGCLHSHTGPSANELGAGDLQRNESTIK